MSDDPINNLKNAIDGVEREWLSSWLTRQGEPPASKLFHYTNGAGLIGILESSLFRATNIFYLNDRTEIKHCADLIKERLDDALQGLSGQIATLLVRARDQFNPFKTLTIYVACFSEVGDQLSQWRGYGHSGGGYAIGISPRKDHPAKVVPKIALRKVIYQRDEQIALIDDSIASLRNLGEQHLMTEYSNDSEKKINLLVRFFKRRVGDYLWCFKDMAFEEEREWRFSYIAGPLGIGFGDTEREIKFRVSESGIAPFVELDILNLQRGENERLVVSDIVCGPTLHPTESMAAVQTLMRVNKHFGVHVMLSRVPLRR